mgnify:CR=1 FL=1|jgi:hypothetical protein
MNATPKPAYTTNDREVLRLYIKILAEATQNIQTEIAKTLPNYSKILSCGHYDAIIEAYRDLTPRFTTAQKARPGDVWLTSTEITSDQTILFKCDNSPKYITTIREKTSLLRIPVYKKWPSHNVPCPECGLGDKFLLDQYLDRNDKQTFIVTGALGEALMQITQKYDETIQEIIANAMQSQATHAKWLPQNDNEITDYLDAIRAPFGDYGLAQQIYDSTTSRKKRKKKNQKTHIKSDHATNPPEAATIATPEQSKDMLALLRYASTLIMWRVMFAVLCFTLAIIGLILLPS